MDKNKNNKNLDNLRHSCAHLLAAAVMELWPDTKRTIGPAIENGFYYDFDFANVKVSEEDFPKIEETMKAILSSWTSFEKHELTADEAKKEFSNNQYKQELIDEFSKGNRKVTFYKSGNYWDLCRGGHVNNPSKNIGVFKLLSVAGAYWRGDEKNPMLTRIYGTCFPTQQELNDYLWQIEEAKKRDHKKIGRELDLFSFHEEGPGFAFWHPKGMRMRRPLIDFWQDLHVKAGYEEVSTPILLTNDVWKKSGHLENYHDKMYFTKADKIEMALKPMNCPGMILIYKNKPRSYRDLPIRWRELGLIHRYEPSGTLNGMLRERAFRQDDAHIFCRESQIQEEVRAVIKLALSLYDVFKFKEVKIELSTRPKKSIGSSDMWKKAETALKKALTDLKLTYQVNEGDGAFYGPKIDFHLKDSLGRSWQCGTIQLDFAMPERFDLAYIDHDGTEKRPIMIHRAIFGSVHRFFAILLEHFGGALPLWLAPVQVIVLPVSNKVEDYAQKVFEELKGEGIRAEFDPSNRPIGAKIREATLQKIPFLCIIGEKERDKSSESEDFFVSVRTREGKDLGEQKLNAFIESLKKDIEKAK